MTNAMPRVVSEEEWQQSIEKFRKQEKALTRMRDAVAANRRRLPATEVTKDYSFESPTGRVSLLDLFNGKRQLILQHFMFHPDWDEGCDGCSMMADHVGPLAHMQSRDTTYVMVSRAPLQKLVTFRDRMGWDIPWVSSFESTFNEDFGFTVNDEEEHGITFLVRDGDRILRTSEIRARGAEEMISTFALLDHTVFGRQEAFEDSPEGWPQSESYVWWRHHDRYDDEAVGCCHGGDENAAPVRS